MSVVYISPRGLSGNSGKTASSALPITSLDKAIQLAGPGGTVLLLSDKGSYYVSDNITISHGGTASAPVTIMGVDSAGHPSNIQINGTRPAVYSPTNPPGNETFKLLDGADNLIFDHMSFANVWSAFRAGADISNITIRNIYADNVRTFFEDYASGTNPTATISGLTIQNVEVHGFSKSAVRLQYDSHDILIQNVLGDSEHEDGDGIAMGISLSGTVHSVTIDHVTMKNAISSGTYYNGDGFATERDVYDVTFKNTIASGNADGGYDLKSTGTTLINAVAVGNGRNFKIWGDATLINPTGLDPHQQGGAGSQLQIQVMTGAHVTVNGGHFSDSGSSTKILQNTGGQIAFSDTEFVHAAGAIVIYGSSSGTSGLDSAKVIGVDATGAYSFNGATLFDALLGPSPTTSGTDSSIATPTPIATPIPTATPTPTSTGSVEAGHTYKFAIPEGSGNQSIQVDFNDTVVTNRPIYDPNYDGIITFGSGGVLDIEKTRYSSGDQMITITGAQALRFIGATDGSYYYEDAGVRPIGAIEGKIADNAFTATADSDTFFFNNALPVNLGSDTIGRFSATDRIVTTQPLSDVNHDGLITANASAAFLLGTASTGDQVKLTDAAGAAVTTVQFDGTRVINGVSYYIYSLPGGAHDLTLG